METPIPKQVPDHPAVPTRTLAGLNRVAPVYLIQLLAATERAGIDSDAVFHGLGVVAEDLDVPGFTVSLTEANIVVRRSLRLLRAADLGLALGMNTKITERGAMALGLMAAPTLGDAIELSLQFPSSAGYLLAVHAAYDGGWHVVTAEPMCGNDDIAPFLVDMMFAASVRLRRQVTEARYAPASIELVRPRPTNGAEYERYFACPVQFGCKRNALTTAQTWFEFPLPMANVMAYRLSRQLLEHESVRVETVSALVLAVERAIRRALPSTAAPAEVAYSLNLSERSLRRKLQDEGLSFRGLLDDARRARALALMAAEKRPIAEIAAGTGFSDTRAFSRAFKRWAGTSPSVLHAAVRPLAPDFEPQA